MLYVKYVMYAAFADARDGKKAVGALLDHGVQKEDLSLVVSEASIQHSPEDWHGALREDNTPKEGVTTTTATDAAVGAAQGVGVGTVLGILGAVAALMIPGFGLVLGGGALATALGAAAGTVAAGALAGGVTGYLKDQGLPVEHAAVFESAVHGGGALLEVQCPSGRVGHDEIESLFEKYGAATIQTYTRTGAVVSN